MNQKKHQIVIVGGGNAGISVAAQLKLKDSSLDIAIIEPSGKHYYQPAWTLVGAGAFDIQKTVREEKDYIPKGITWIQEKADQFFPEENFLTTSTNMRVDYEHLVVCPGIQLNWHLIEGLEETIGKNGVSSNYTFELAPYTYECMRNFKGGTALFTNPGTPVKCGGAPQKIMYLFADNLRKRKLLDKSSVEFCSAGSKIFGIKKYADALMGAVNRYGIKLNFKHELVAINGEKQEATFEVTDQKGGKSKVVKKFDFIHVTPPQSAPDFIRNSPLANAGGWVDVDKYTTQHNTYKNIFSLGDASGLPNAKTGAAVRKQAPVVVKNLLSAIRNQHLEATYNGYGSCPLVTGYGKLVLAEFDYDNTPMETFPFDQGKERYSMYLLKTKILPWLYWNRILSGKA